MPTKTIVFNSVDGLNRALRGLAPEASEQLRQAAQSLASDIADEAAGRARSQGGVSALVAPSITGKRDRVPTIRMGNSTKLPVAGNGWERKSRKGKHQTIGDIIWGAEFGGSRGTRSVRRTSQFKPWTGNDTGAGYFLYPTIRDRSDDMADAYGDAVLEAIDLTAKLHAQRKATKR